MKQTNLNLVISVVSLAIPLLGCGGDAPNLPPQPVFAAPSTYERPYPDCDPIPPVNCSAVAEFEKDGTVFVRLTDQGNAGHYVVAGDKVQLTFFTQGDADERMQFTISPDASELTNDKDAFIWSRRPAPR